MIVLLEEQNSILRKIARGEKEEEKEYEVTKEMILCSSPDLDYPRVKNMERGERLKVLEKGAKVLIDDIEAYWFKVKDGQENVGWCFSGYLREV
jgi:hypothetical protein